METSHEGRLWEVVVEPDPADQLLSRGVAMKHSYLEVTYRKGRLLAAYYYLPRRDEDRSVRTERVDGGLLVDFSSDGRPIGIEISSPSQFDLPALNKVLRRLGHEPVKPEDLSPLVAA